MAPLGNDDDKMDIVVEEKKGEAEANEGKNQEEEIDPLHEEMEKAEEQAILSADKGIDAYMLILTTSPREDPVATKVKEECIYKLTRLYANNRAFQAVMDLLKVANTLFEIIPKAKTAKIVRTVIDLVANVPDSLDLQVALCKEVIAWCQQQKRTFLRQRIEARLSALYFLQGLYNDGIVLVNRLLRELKKFDDKQMLLEVHLVEARINHALRNLPKAKAALTAARTAGNSIYIVPLMQGELDMMSGMLHCEEGDYKTSFSYFLEAYEAFDSQNDLKALTSLKYMSLCQILLGADGDMTTVTSKIKYSGHDEMKPLLSIAKAAKSRSLEEFDETHAVYEAELSTDLLVKHHLHILYEQMLEANLTKIVEPFSCVEIDHVATLIKLPLPVVEKKLSQMILDRKINGTLDQGKGHLVLFEENKKDDTFADGLKVFENVNTVVDALFRRADNLVR